MMLRRLAAAVIDVILMLTMALSPLLLAADTPHGRNPFVDDRGAALVFSGL
jgi:hypothetical protein